MKLFYQCLAAVIAGIALAMAMMLIAPPARGEPAAAPRVEWIRHVLLEMELNGEPAWLELIVLGDPRHATREACIRDAARFRQARAESALPVKVFCEERRKGAEFGGEQVQVQ